MSARSLTLPSTCLTSTLKAWRRAPSASVSDLNLAFSKVEYARWYRLNFFEKYETGCSTPSSTSWRRTACTAASPAWTDSLNGRLKTAAARTGALVFSDLMHSNAHWQPSDRKNCILGLTSQWAELRQLKSFLQKLLYQPAIPKMQHSSRWETGARNDWTA